MEKDREQLVYLASLAEQAERYDGIAFMDLGSPPPLPFLLKDFGIFDCYSSFGDFFNESILAVFHQVFPY